MFLENINNLIGLGVRNKSASAFESDNIIFTCWKPKMIFFNGQNWKLFKTFILWKTYLFDLIWSKIYRVNSNLVNKEHRFFQCGTSESPLTKIKQIYLQLKKKALVSSIFLSFILIYPMNTHYQHFQSSWGSGQFSSAIPTFFTFYPLN